MAIKAIFARNLRALCKARGGSINAICREIGIGRTQMDRYLNGEHLPNELNLKKISAFFRIEDTALFALTVPGGDSEGSGEVFDDACRGMAEAMLSQGPSALPDGAYHTCFVLASDPEQAMLSLTVVRRRGLKTVFRRLTRFSDAGTGAGPRSRLIRYRGVHDGVVVDRFDAHYFIGLNTVGTREPSLNLVRRLPLGEPLLGGRALIMGEKGPAALAVVMRALPPGSGLIGALRLTGVVSINSELIGHQAAQYLRQPFF